MVLKIFCLILLIILEIPLSVKCRQASNNGDIVRFAAVAILMFLVGLLVYGIYMLFLFVLR